MSSILLLGFLMGLRHAVETDHVAAVVTLSAQNETKDNLMRSAIRLGALWGLGHAVALFSIGALFIGLSIDAPESFSGWMEFAVGIMLVSIGLDLLYRLFKKRIHFHLHRHENGNLHFHAHSHDGTTIHTEDPHSHRHHRVASVRSLLIGMVHGMAGSAALMVLAAGAFESYEMSLLYMAIFAVGSMGGMVVLSLMIVLPLQKAGKSLLWAQGGIQGVVAVLTISVGASLSISNIPSNIF
ncbi:MAG: hypothetical protein KAR80_00850 [Rhodospirillaceae bacterium]|nr:hypothetical protein [Rhodospirillaceae bacterium]